MFARLALVALSIVSLLMAACAQGGPVPAYSADQPNLSSAPPDLEYLLGPRDKLRIIVYGEEGLSGEFFVSGGGKVSFPLIGEVQAAGLTVQAFQNGLQDALRRGYLKDPRVSAEVLTYRPYYILGEVNKPGEYTYSNGLNVLNAVATAGGFTYRAQQNRVYIRRAQEASERAYPLTSELRVSPGDTIRIGERFF